MTQLSDADQDRIAQLVREVARDEIMTRFQNLDADDTQQKSGPLDLVTAADLAAEARLTEGLQRLFPSALVVGEESITAQPSLRDALDVADLAFVIDPVDGTWNFAHGMPLFGVILAATTRGHPFYGLLHDPVSDNWMTAQTGGPARQVWGNGRSRELRTGPARGVENQSGYMHFFLMPQDIQHRLAPALPGFGRVYAIRCSCHEYRTLAQGSVDYCLSGMLNPWDHAAGVVITQAAGGHVAMLDGAPYDTTRREGYLLASASREGWQAARDHLAGYLETPA